jgi:choline dehydrogenase-like flavoprotein
MPPAETDVCVVGAGASGAVVAKELAERGLRVVVLEVGEHADRSRIPTPRHDWEHRLGDFTPGDPGRDRVTFAAESDPTFRLSRFKGVGGSTMHYEGFCTRMHPDDLRRRTKVGVGADWPIAYDTLAPLYDRVEKTLGLSGRLDNPFDPPRGPYPNPALEMSCAVKRVKKGCDALGLHAAHAPTAILSQPSSGRSACNFCGGCWSGCFMGAISNAAQTYVPRALEKGAELRTGCMSTRVVVASNGKTVEGVEYLDERGALQLQKARAVAICGNAVETARLLLLSQRPDHPDGLANGSGLIGRYFTGHTRVSLQCLFAERVDAYKGPNINGMVQDFYDHADERDFAGGYIIALRNAELGPLSFYHHWARRRGLMGRELVSFMEQQFGHSVSISAYGEHFATDEDRVTLDPDEKDPFGLPVPRISIQRRENERAMEQHMAQTLRAILDAAGAHEVTLRDEPEIMGTHLLGTCRMGEDPATSVTDPYGETHEVKNLFVADGSLFPSSTPSNPTLTIQALATRVARRIAERALQA